MYINHKLLTSSYSSYKDDTGKTQRELFFNFYFFPNLAIYIEKELYYDSMWITISFKWLIFYIGRSFKIKTGEGKQNNKITI